MDEAELAGTLAAVRERARSTFWRIWALRFLPMFVVMFLVLRLLDPHNDDSVSTTFVGVLVGVVPVAVFMFVAAKRRWRCIPEPPLAAGLARTQRRAVNRDLRRGEPNVDPLLREIEHITAQRYRRAGLITALIGPIAVAAFVAFTVTSENVGFALVGAQFGRHAGRDRLSAATEPRYEGLYLTEPNVQAETARPRVRV